MFLLMLVLAATITSSTLMRGRCYAFSPVPHVMAVAPKLSRTSFVLNTQNIIQNKRKRRRRRTSVTVDKDITASPSQYIWTLTSTYLYSISPNDGFLSSSTSNSNGIDEKDHEINLDSNGLEKPSNGPPTSSLSPVMSSSSSYSPAAVILSRDVARQTLTYEASFPLYQMKTTAKDHEATISNAIGMTLRQVNDGQISNLALDMDTLQYVSSTSSTDSMIDQQYNDEDKEKVKLNNKSYMILEEDEAISDEFVGVVVSSVQFDAIAYQAGVRPGDVVLATSATMGDQLWPKTTLEGVRSALTSRKIMSNKPEAVIRFNRSREHISASEVTETFDIILTKPLGLQLQNLPEGKVIISGFIPTSTTTIAGSDYSSAAESILQVGDRIVAVDSSLGSQLWPVSSVEGVVSAVTARLPGQSIRFRIERTVQVGEYPTRYLDQQQQQERTTTDEISLDDPVTPALNGAVDGYRQLTSASASGVYPHSTTATAPTTSISSSSSTALDTSNTPGTSVIPTVGSKTHKLLLTRCRDVLRTYIAKAKQGENSRQDDLSTKASKILVFAADRVLEALADARAPLDAKTLTLIMNSYTSAREPEKAFTAFEAAVGLAADGSSSSELTRSHIIRGKKNPDARIPSDVGALNLFTATALLRAHALNGDIASARRVLSAMEASHKGTLPGYENPSILWPVKLYPDVRTYNIVLAAAAKAGGKAGIDAAVSLFQRMSEPGTSKSERVGSTTIPEKNLVTYNTMISVFAKEGRSQDAYTIFYSMKQAGIKPDKITYTSLIKALVEDGDIMGGKSLLTEMKENGLESDVFTYNIVIKALCKRLKWFEAKNLVALMDSSGVSPNSITYGLLMNGLLKAGKASACLILFEAAYSDPKTTSLTENVQLYTTAISAASALGDYERALDLVARMQKVGVKPTVKTLTAIMGACLSCNKANIAVDVYQQMGNIQERRVDGLALTLAVRAFCEQGNFTAAASIITEQRDGKQEMSGKEVMSSYNVLLKSSLQANNFLVARSSFTELLQSGYIPSKDTYKGILQGLGVQRTRGNNEEERQPHYTSLFIDKYEFLLFIIDSLRQRNLPCDAWIYLEVLLQGARVGGKSKIISSFLSKTRTDSPPKKSSNSWSWEVLMKMQPSQIRILQEDQSLSLPPLFVPLSDRSLRQVLNAENAVTVFTRKRRAALKKV